MDLLQPILIRLWWRIFIKFI